MDASSSVPPPARPKKRTGTSKYDFIKVKVWLGENLDHYYILSRFLICRMLTVTKIPYIKAVKIALETKKYLVDNNLHDVTQAQLEDVLFGIVRAKGFDEAHIDCYRMVTQFYQSRQPLCIIICGAAWTGKSTLAQQLAARINIPNVMQTDVIYELLRSGPDSPLHPVPLWARPGLAGGRCCNAALVREFRREARVVREGMEGDLIKTLSDGKPIIIEGLHLDPGLYIPDFGSRGLIMLPSRPTAALSAAAAVAAAGGGVHAAAAAGRSPGSSPLAGRGRYRRSLTMPERATTGPAADGAGFGAGSDSMGPGSAGRAEADQRQSQSDQEGEQAPTQQQQGVVLRPRSASAAEVSVSVGGPLSPGSLVPPSAAVSAEAALVLLRNGSASQQQQQQHQHQQPWQSGHGQESSQQQLHQQQERQVQQQQPQRLLRVSEEPSQAEQQLPSLPPLPPLRVRRQKQQQDATTVDMYGYALGNSSSSSSSTVHHCLPPFGVSSTITSSVKQSVQCKELMGTPFADAAAAGAAAGAPSGTTSPAAAAAAADTRPMDRLFSEPDDLPVAMTGEEVQVCAAAAEAAALQQHRQQQQAHQQLQQQLQQQGRPQPGSPFSSASDVSSLGVGGGSPPCISQEHSTTEVVSRVCSCASLGSPAVLLSQEPSGAEVWSPVAAAAGIAAAATPDAAGCGAFMCRQLSSGGVRGSSFRVRGSPCVSSRYLEQLPEEGTEQRQQQQQLAVAATASQQVLQQEQQQPQIEQKGLPSLVKQQAPQLRPASASAPEAAQASSDSQQQLVATADAAAASEPAAGMLVCSEYSVEVMLDTVATSQGSATDDPAAKAQQSQSYPAAAAAAGTALAQTQPAQTKATHAHTAQRPQERQGEEPSTALAADSSAAAKPGKTAETEPVGKPLFVPILVYMDEADHALMADEALSHLGLPDGKTGAGTDNSAASGTDRLSDSMAANGIGSSRGDTASSSCMHSAGEVGDSSGGGESGRSGDGESQQQQQQQQQQSGVTVSEALRRVRLLQEYLCAYEAQGLPVVKVSYGAFGDALDKLHEYVLQCIKVAMQSRQIG